MARRQAEADPGLVWDALDESDRATMARWCAVLNLPADAWFQVPPLRTIATMVAAYRVAEGIEGSRAEALREATRSLGIHDKGRGSHPAEGFERLRAYWRAATGKHFSAEDAERG